MHETLSTMWIREICVSRNRDWQQWCVGGTECMNLTRKVAVYFCRTQIVYCTWFLCKAPFCSILSLPWYLHTKADLIPALWCWELFGFFWKKANSVQTKNSHYFCIHTLCCRNHFIVNRCWNDRIGQVQKVPL